MPFEFRLSRRDVQSYLDLIRPTTNDDVWFNGVVDLKTWNVTSANMGRQQNAAEISGTKDTAAIHVVDEQKDDQ